jgi:hypothetical protein
MPGPEFRRNFAGISMEGPGRRTWSKDLVEGLAKDLVEGLEGLEGLGE